ncbi:MAG: methylated-DNA--[protein]-cysteine S-methyltransferase [Peptococcaceae bacterium]|jgi:methylated-DNA-[protein]-cysteine S-methyltransferase|nr:methylated-DNA--[protein]-cysteine S-methyltransferase [Peptococcaceae bacterium]
MKSIYFYATPIGRIGVAESEGRLTNLFFPAEKIAEPAIEVETGLLQEAGEQLERYFSGKLKDFTLPLTPVGTDFMQRVWACLQTIPYGETWSYQKVAQTISQPKACRAVGLANHRNPLPIFIPCHRVIGKNGDLTGFGGGLELKSLLLDLEKEHLASFISC